ncbi:MAG: metal ABC transporter permease [Pseudomonadota bacterium]|jgi:zinc transport system permease protein|nr:metal ABC transporter permease [Syntrophaceae bacterium]MDI9555653.1 metal ABC transporter permease [Pseudomonadota bacterium]NLX31297.1 metal ABC transporter permease [Deltaproteobacteria bacterium]HNU84435.1 metal ABC transporter permease [Syntrophales bacterium]HNZ34367.1 metal ABC transporter permease [Syntrophales bacterium]
MGEFLTDLPRYPFLQHALLVGALAGVACGIIGSYVVTKKISTIAGSISHTVLGGLGAARYCQVVHGWDWFHPLYGAVLAALIAALVIGLVGMKARQREDTVIGALWAVGMAAGILFISRTPGYSEDLMSYLFGSILMVSAGDLWLIAGLDLFVVVVAALFYNQFLAVCFDEEFARLRGVRVEGFYLLLLCMTALTVVLLVTVVGIIMVIAIITLPAAVAGEFTKRLWHMMLLSALLTVAFTTAGLALSYGPDLPAGATIIAVAGTVYLASVVGVRLFRLKR